MREKTEQERGMRKAGEVHCLEFLSLDNPLISSIRNLPAEGRDQLLISEAFFFFFLKQARGREEVFMNHSNDSHNYTFY